MAYAHQWASLLTASSRVQDYVPIEHHSCAVSWVNEFQPPTNARCDPRRAQQERVPIDLIVSIAFVGVQQYAMQIVTMLRHPRSGNVTHDLRTRAHGNGLLVWFKCALNVASSDLNKALLTTRRQTTPEQTGRASSPWGVPSLATLASFRKAKPQATPINGRTSLGASPLANKLASLVMLSRPGLSFLMPMICRKKSGRQPSGPAPAPHWKDRILWAVSSFEMTLAGGGGGRLLDIWAAGGSINLDFIFAVTASE